MLEQWICVQDSEGAPGCGFVLIVGVMGAEIPRACPKCGGHAWNIIGDPMFCRVTKGKHDWNEGVDRNGMPFPAPGQMCKACGAVPVVQGVN